MIQIIIGGILISFSSVFVKLVHVGPTSAMFYRFLFGALALFIAALISKAYLLPRFKYQLNLERIDAIFWSCAPKG